MKITVIHGSMRKGNTYSVTQSVLERLRSYDDVQITEFSVVDLNLPFCHSCHVCFAKGEEFCPHFNVVSNIQVSMAESDGIILSGTTYMWALNASMKNLLDHFAYQFHRPTLFGKKGLVITTSAGAGEKSVAKYMKTVLGQWGVNGALIVTLNEKEKQLNSSYDKKFAHFAERFYKIIKSGRFLNPKLKNIAVHNAFRAMSLSEFGESERDKQHWSMDGFRNRAYPVKAGVFQYAVGWVVHGLVRVMTRIIGNVKFKSK